MNPYQHSDVAGEVYRVICDFATKGNINDQGDQGTLACKIAEMLAKDFDLELQPHEMGGL